jgi:hypothetical protein
LFADGSDGQPAARELADDRAGIRLEQREQDMFGADRRLAHPLRLQAGGQQELVEPRSPTILDDH